MRLISSLLHSQKAHLLLSGHIAKKRNSLCYISSPILLTASTLWREITWVLTTWQSSEFELFSFSSDFTLILPANLKNVFSSISIHTKEDKYRFFLSNEVHILSEKVNLQKYCRHPKMEIFGSVLLIFGVGAQKWFCAHWTQTQYSVCHWFSLKTQTQVISPLDFLFWPECFIQEARSNFIFSTMDSGDSYWIGPSQWIFRFFFKRFLFAKNSLFVSVFFAFVVVLFYFVPVFLCIIIICFLFGKGG